jgi:ribosomal protein S18 acetylase RimI-like enzyme
LQLTLVPSNDVQQLTVILQDADEDVERIISAVEDDVNASYLALYDQIAVGAVVMHWHPEESEILYIAIDKAYRGQGYGKVCIAQIREEARTRHVRSLVVGTANSSLDNIAFYQKCGFTMDTIRKGYFSYLPTPVYEDGILMRDMLVLRSAIPAAE